MGEWEWGEGKKEEKTVKDERRKRKVGKEGKGNTSQEQIRLSSFCSLSLNDMGKRQQLKKEETHKHKYLFLVFLRSMPVAVMSVQLVYLLFTQQQCNLRAHGLVVHLQHFGDRVHRNIRGRDLKKSITCVCVEETEQDG